MNHEMHMAIRLLNEHSLSVITGNRQIKNGTIMVMDDILGTRYTIHENGYARKRVFGYPFNMMGGGAAGRENNHYQLNKTRRVKRDYGYGERECVERILLPGEYLALAKMVVNAANRERVAAENK
jgi:hypothetical protein